MSQDWNRLAELEKQARDELQWTNIQIAKASATELALALDAHRKAKEEPTTQEENKDIAIPEKIVDLSAKFPNAPHCVGRGIINNHALLDMLIACYELVSPKTVDADSILESHTPKQ